MSPDILKKQVLAIAALARDCEHSLVNIIPLIEELRSFFYESYVIVVENDSKDSTKSILSDWSKKCHNVHVISNDYNVLTIPLEGSINANPYYSNHRISKMAYYRNMYMDYLETLDINIDYLMIIDIDVCSFKVDGLIKSLINAPSNWGGLFALGESDVMLGKSKLTSCYYDSYAFVAPNKYPYIIGKDFVLSNRKYVYLKSLLYKYIECNSAFSGMGVYKYHLVKEQRYIVRRNEGVDSNFIELVCEHIPFNLSVIKKGYKNYVSTDMKLKYRENIPLYIFISQFIPNWIKNIIHKFNNK